MDKNKSIDGLATRRNKISASLSKPSQTTPKKTTKSTKSTNTIKSASKSAKPTINSVKAAPKKTTKSANRKTATRKPKSTSAKKPIIQKTANPNLPPETDPTTDVAVQPTEPTQSTQSTEPAELQPSPTAAEDFLTPTQVFNFDESTGELKASTTKEEIQEQSENKKHKEKKAKKPVSKKRKIITSIILTIVILLIGFVIWLIIWGNDIIAKITGGQGNIFDLITFTEPTYEPLKTDENGRTNILAFGTSGYNMEGDEGEGTHDGAQLTDSIMAISLNQETGDVAMISLPRDLKASPTCTATGKINEVYWCNNMDGNNEQAGAEAIMEEVGNILDIDFQYYAHLNWGSLVSIVDILGGITVTLDEGIYDYYYTKAVFDPGVPYTIDGGQALGLARARHGTEGGDFSRGASQQKILIGIKDKVLEKSLSITDLLGLASTLGDNLRTNFSVEELKTMAHLAVDLDLSTIRQVSLTDLMTTGTINGISYVLPVGGAGYYTNIQSYVAKMLSNNPSVYEEATILVLNGTETPGLASSEKATMEEEGYNNISIDDAPEGKYTKKYTLYTLTDDKPGTKKALETKYGESQPTEELPTGISEGYNFVLILGDDNQDTKTTE